MSKYKICKFVDGNGHEWYQIQKRYWFFWDYLCGYKGGAPEFSPRRIPLKFYSMEEVDKCIKLEEIQNNQLQIKKVECFDYDG